MEIKFSLEDICEDEKQKLNTIVLRWSKYYSDLYVNEIAKGEPKAVINLGLASKGVLEVDDSTRKKIEIIGDNSLIVNNFSLGLFDCPQKYYFLFRSNVDVTLDGLLVEEWQKKLKTHFSFNLAISVNPEQKTSNGIVKPNFAICNTEQPQNIKNFLFEPLREEEEKETICSTFAEIYKANRVTAVLDVNCKETSIPLSFVTYFLFPIIRNVLLEQFKFEISLGEQSQVIRVKDFGSW